MTTRVSRSERYRQVCELLEQGYASKEIGQMLGLSYSHVRGLISDPDGSLDRQRKESYGGVCGKCGAPTTGSNGPSKAPRFCNHCAPREQQGYWTPDTVVAAIQEWARRYGKPPTATEWLDLKGDRNRDGDYRFPPASAIYSYNGRVGPFETWADAIEAAGFDRPIRGHYERKPTMSVLTRTYVVFTVHDNGDLSIVGETEASTNQQAIEALATDAGQYASVAKGSLQMFTLAPRLVASRSGT